MKFGFMTVKVKRLSVINKITIKFIILFYRHKFNIPNKVRY
jgi:hypothetical protein